MRARTDSALVAERTARIAGDEQLAARIASLSADLDSLRTTYGARITAMEDGVRFAMPVTFAFDDATVREADRPMLERFARVANRYYAGSAITVEGFADPAGTTQYNAALSRRRAENVRATLESLGLTGNALRAVGYGETRLVTPGASRDEPGADRNRRVVFVIESAGAGADAAIALGQPMH